MTEYMQFKLQVLTFLQGYAMGAKQDHLTEDAKETCKKAFSGIQYQIWDIEEIFKTLQ